MQLLKAYELWFPQNWSPVELPWEELDSKNFSKDAALAQAYWMSKLALFEKSGIGAFGLAALQAGRYNMEDPTKKFLEQSRMMNADMMKSAEEPAAGYAHISLTGISLPMS